MKLAILAGSAISAAVFTIGTPAFADCHAEIRSVCHLLNGYPDSAAQVPETVLEACKTHANATCPQTVGAIQQPGTDLSAVSAAQPSTARLEKQ